MGVPVESLIMEVVLQGQEKAKAGLDDLKEHGGILAKGLEVTGLAGAAGILAIGTAAVGVGGIALKMAGDFQEGMTSLITGAGESEKNIDLVRQGILAMAVDTATSTKQLTDGMYMIESAGYHGADGLKVLQAAAEGAKVGNADLAVVADATTTVMKDYPNVMGGATGAVNLLIATVANGKTHMQDLAGSLSQILPTAAAAHVGLNDIAGGMATMTGEGIPAAQAATYLRQTILALEAPGKKAVDTLHEVGLSSADVAKEMQKSLPDALQMITDAVGKKFPEGSAKYVEALKDIAGGSRTMQGILDLTGSHMHDFRTNVDSVTGAVKNGGKEIKGWSDVQGDFNFQVQKAWQQVQTLGIQLGTALLPIATDVMKFFNTQAVPIIKDVTNWLSGLGDTVTNVDEPTKTWKGHIDETTTVLVTHKGTISNLKDFLHNDVVPVLKAVGDGFHTVGNMVQWVKDHMDVIMPIVVGLGAAILVVAIASLPPLIIGFIGWAAAAGAAAIATIAATWPVLAVAAAIGILVGFLIYAYTHWEWFRVAVEVAKEQLQNIWAFIQNNVLPVLGFLWQKIGDGLGKLGEFRDFVQSIYNRLGDLIEQVWKFIDSLKNIHLPDFGGWHLPGFASGTDDAPGGLAKVHKDEIILLPQHSKVIPAAQAASYGQTSTLAPRESTKVTNIHNHFYASMNDTLVARVIAEQKWQATLHGG